MGKSLISTSFTTQIMTLRPNIKQWLIFSCGLLWRETLFRRVAGYVNLLNKILEFGKAQQTI
ncbi:MAG: hypothetical protein AUK48_00085 [Oscillatoriales cyanobacterium CG2_30_44_21]|nr:MAG: hypothetical protein AUK48_00085 [Oscillatoriales cyanobacterium CG2_30_44_21]